MKAVVIDRSGDKQEVSVRDLGEEALGEGDVTVRVEYSTLNYKDGLAITGTAPVVRRFPMVPGIDFAGTVERSDDPRFRTGDAVILNGWGVGEKHFGGYAEKARVRGDWLVPLPKPLSARQAMAIGTAGYTAMLSVMSLERHGVTPADGPAVVTGAAGGVGSVAASLLAQAGWHVVAVTGRTEETEYLRSLGAKEIVARDELTAAAKPLARERWAAGVDSVGSSMLANLLSMTKYGGAIAACGLAGGMDLPASVAPFILRGVALLGVDSVMAPRELRLEAWQRLARTLDLERLESMVSTIALEDVIDAAARIVQGKVRGRLVVAVA